MKAPFSSTLALRLLAGFGTVALLTSIGLLASRPARSVGGPVAVSIANVPLSTTPTDNSAKQGVQIGHFVTIAPTQYGGAVTTVYTVPAGKRLVIETVTADDVNAQDTNFYNISVLTQGGLGNTYVTGQLDLVPDGTFSPSASVRTVQYADAGTTVGVEVLRAQTSGSSAVQVTFTGYLVDIATPGGSS